MRWVTPSGNHPAALLPLTPLRGTGEKIGRLGRRSVWADIKTGSLLTNYHHRQSRLSMGNLIYCQLKKKTHNRTPEKLEEKWKKRVWSWVSGNKTNKRNNFNFNSTFRTCSVGPLAKPTAPEYISWCSLWFRKSNWLYLFKGTLGLWWSCDDHHCTSGLVHVLVEIEFEMTKQKDYIFHFLTEHVSL